MKTLRARLAQAGVARPFLNRVVLPAWWDDSLAATPGGLREAASFVCAHLGFSLASLLDAGRPLAFAERGAVKYKKSKGVTDAEVGLATHYALGVARAMAAAWADRPAATAVPAPKEWRDQLLAGSKEQWIRLGDIVQAAWALGIPVLHLRSLPAGGKKPDALTTMVGERPVIVILNQRKSPSWLAFIVAHELGHLHHRHLKPGQTLVDEKMAQQSDEAEEREANEFASRLLTGHSDLGLSSSRSLGAGQLAQSAQTFGQKYRIAPGVAALNFGFTTGKWAVANGAVSRLERAEDAGAVLEAALLAHVNRADLTDESWAWIARATRAAG
jgi:hypothetical protein